MSHEHKFESVRSREADRIDWDDEKEQVVLEWDCKEDKLDTGRGGFGAPPRGGTRSTKQCSAVRKQYYEIRSVSDYHNVHDRPEDNNAVDFQGGTSTSIGYSSLDNKPEWVSQVRKKGKGKFRSVDAEFFMCFLGGEEISVLLQTSESEYYVIINRVSEEIVE